MREPAGYGRYDDDSGHIRCPRARTDTTPCIARDEHALADNGSCVGCGERPDLLLRALVDDATSYALEATAERDELRNALGNQTEAGRSFMRATIEFARVIEGLKAERAHLRRLLADIHHGLYPYEGTIDDDEAATMDHTLLPKAVADVNTELNRLHVAVVTGSEMMDNMPSHNGPADKTEWHAFRLILAALVNDGLMDPTADDDDVVTP